MILFRPLPRRFTRGVSSVVVVAWLVTMALLVKRAYVQASAANLAIDLARYGTAAEWRGVYYRGDKIGFTVTQTTPQADGFEVREDSRLQMSLLGATTAAIIQTRAQVGPDFSLRSFDFSLDPGTGPLQVHGDVTGRHISLTITTKNGSQHAERDLQDAPVLSLNLPRRLAAGGLKTGVRHEWVVFDPATLRNEPATVEVGKREIVDVFAPIAIRVRGREMMSATRRPIPAFRVETTFAGLKTSSWITDTGEVVREESPLGLSTQRESPETARRLAASGRTPGGGILDSAAVIPRTKVKGRIDDTRDVRRLQLRVDGVDLANSDLEGAGQSVDGSTVEIVDARTLQPGPADADAATYLTPEPLIESDDPAIHAEAVAAVAGATDRRLQAERLVRRVNGMLDKKPTISLPSAREVLRTKVGDCNEHTALYVAMARSIGIPARIAVGLAYVRGAFYYHAWPEVYLDAGHNRGLWLPVDPTFNQFPADATHLRLARGGLDRQAAILPLIGRIKLTMTALDLAPGSTPILVGRGSVMAPVPFTIPARVGLTCWASPASSTR